MKKFARHRNFEEVFASCQAQGVRVDAIKYLRGSSDLIVVGGPIEPGDEPSLGHVLVNDFNAYVLYNVFNGRFQGRTHRGEHFSSGSTKHEKEPWFQALLSFFYVEKETDPPPEVRDARYARGMKAVSCPSPDGYKTRAARLAEVLKGRYSGRENAYILSPSKVDKLLALWRAGRDGSVITNQLYPEETHHAQA